MGIGNGLVKVAGMEVVVAEFIAVPVSITIRRVVVQVNRGMVRHVGGTQALDINEGRYRPVLIM